MTFVWLIRGRARADTEALIVAAQDQALQTSHYEKEFVRTRIEDKYSLCETQSETI